MASGGRTRRLAASPGTRRDHRLALAVGLLALAIYLLTVSSDLLGNGDTSTFRFGTTQAIVDHHRLWLDLTPGPQELRAVPGRGGHVYASYGPGQSLMMIPFYLLGKLAAHRFHLDYAVAEAYATRCLGPVLAAFAAALLVLFALLLGYSRRISALLGIGFAFASVAWPDEQSGLEQTAIELFLLSAAYAVSRWNIKQRESNRRLLWVCGGALGLAFWTRYDAAIYLPLFALYVYSRTPGAPERSPRFRNAAIVVGGFMPFAAFVCVWNTLTFGLPWSTGSHPDTFSSNVVGNALGLALSPGKGIVWYFPLIIALVWAARPFLRRTGPVALLFASLVGLTFAFYACVAYWHGDPAWGPRYLYPITPFLVLPLGELCITWPRLLGFQKLTIGLLVAASLGIQIAAVSVTPWRFWYHLQATQQQTYNPAEWSGTPFFWGPTHYHYYWNPSLSPLLLQIDGLTQVIRLQVLGETRYLLQTKPATFVQTNTASAYPVNTLAFWWADDRHPVAGPVARDALVFLLLCLAAASALDVARSSRGAESLRVTVASDRAIA